MPKNTRIVLLEDVTTTAASARKALQVLRDESYNVVAIVAIIDRRRVPEDNVDGVPFRAVFNIEQLLNPDDLGAL